MKKLIIIIVLIVLAGGAGYYFVNSKASVTNTDDTQNTGGTSKPDPSNATFDIEGEAVTLSQGKNLSSPISGSAIVEETTLMDEFAYGDINDDDKNDTVLLLAHYGGGSGTFIYVAAYVSGPVNHKGTDAIFLGDRIAPKSISINQGVITVTYLDRKESDPLSAEPTVSVSKKFVYRNNQLQEN